MEVLKREKSEKLPYVVGRDHLRDIIGLVNLTTNGHPERVIDARGLQLEWSKIPENYRLLIKQSALFQEVGGLERCAREHFCFTTLASRPHIPYVCEVPADEYVRWHDQSFAKISDALQRSSIEKLPPHHVHWLMNPRRQMTWNNLSDIARDKSINLLTDFAAHIMQVRDLIASGFPDRQIVSAIAVGYAGPKQIACNAQSYGTAHVHTVAHSKLPITLDGKMSLNVMQEMMYRDNLYYPAVQALASGTLVAIAKSFRQAGVYGFEIDTQKDERVFDRTCFRIKPGPHHPITLEQVLFATTNLNRIMRELWKFFLGKRTQVEFHDARVEEVQKMLQDATRGGRQKFPRTPGFTVVVWWEGDRIVKIEIAPALHGPAERLNNAIVHLG